MALTQIIKEIANDPDGLKALGRAFHLVQEVPFQGPPEVAKAQLYKTFRIKGQGVPDSDKYVRVLFERTLKGQARVASWTPADQESLL